MTLNNILKSKCLSPLLKYATFSRLLEPDSFIPKCTALFQRLSLSTSQAASRYPTTMAIMIPTSRPCFPGW